MDGSRTPLELYIARGDVCCPDMSDEQETAFLTTVFGAEWPKTLKEAFVAGVAWAEQEREKDDQADEANRA